MLADGSEGVWIGRLYILKNLGVIRLSRVSHSVILNLHLFTVNI